MTYFEFTKRFPSENAAIDFIVSAKFKDGYVCPKCGCVHKVYHQKLLAVLKRVCKPDTTVMADEFTGYDILDDGIRANGIGSFWAILKRGVYGIFHNVSAKCLRSYADEFCFQLNHMDNAEAFNTLVRLAVK